jgi:hypothetical protein
MCGKNQLKEKCSHIKGKEYGNHRLCFYDLSEVIEVYEWAFVNEPDEMEGKQ